MVRVIKLTTELTDEEADKFATKKLPKDGSYDILVKGEDVNVFKPNGDPLILFRHKVLPKEHFDKAFPALRTAAGTSFNRGTAAGEVKQREDAIGVGTRFNPIKKDGTVSKTHYAEPVESGIIGYYDRNPRFPYCRTTAFNLKTPEKFLDALPLLQSIDKIFKRECPERHEAQMDMIRKTSQDFVINKTAFTTITVNKNWVTGVHKDQGDLKEGFGVMTALRAGDKEFKGCYLVFPKFRVAVDMQNQDVLLADVHEWHGNTPLIGIKGTFERISLVCYYREAIIECGTAAQEMDRAKSRIRGDKLKGKIGE